MGNLYWDDVVLRLTCDGADASTTFSDLSPAGTTVTVGGSAQVDTAQKKWGTGSALFNGTGDVLSFPGLLDTSDSFTARFYYRSAGAHETSARLFQTAPGDSLTAISLIASSSTQIQLYGYNGVGGWSAGPINATVVVGTQHFIEVSYSADLNRMYLFVDGVLIGSAAIVMTDSSGSTWVIGGQTGSPSRSLNGHIDDVEITQGVALNTSGYTPPTEALPTSKLFEARTSLPSLMGAPAAVVAQLIPSDARISIPSLMGSPAAVVRQYISARSSIPSLMGNPSAIVQNDFSALITDTTQRYVVRITGAPIIDVSVSSWQATLQTGRQNYVQCVVPAVTDQIDDLQNRVGLSEIIVYKTGYIGETLVETEMARAPLSLVINNRGPFRDTATMSGYSTATSPPVSGAVRTMTGVRQTTQNAAGNSRARCDIDWVLKPGQDVIADGFEFTANYINYFVPAVGDAYMDIGSRG